MIKNPPVYRNEVDNRKAAKMCSPTIVANRKSLVCFP